MILKNHCPVCGSDDFHLVFEVCDYLVTGEYFGIQHCRNCTLRFTSPVPDEKEIGRYYHSEKYVSHTAERSSGLFSGVYKTARGFMLARKRNWIEKITRKKTGSILDIGCGTGAFLQSMHTAGWVTAGIEADEGARRTMADHYSLQAFPPDRLVTMEDNSFDVITLWHVLEHIHDLHGYMNHICRLLMPEGYALIAVPNYNCYDAGYYREFWAGYDVPRHLYHFSYKAMEKLLTRFNMKVLKIKPLPLDPFYNSLLSEGYKRKFHGSVKSNFFTAIFAGGVSFLKMLSDKRCASSILYVAVK